MLVHIYNGFEVFQSGKVYGHPWSKDLEVNMIFYKRDTINGT